MTNLDNIEHVKMMLKQSTKIALLGGFLISISLAAEPQKHSRSKALNYESQEAATKTQQQPHPSTNSANKHMGVASCASSVCHGSPIERKDGNILQNEYVIWGGDDAHSKSFQILASKKSKSIARKLGLKSAQKAKICLDCHTDNIPKKLQGKKFLASDGVGCEACHGGSEFWLASHSAGNHQQNLTNGLLPLDDIEVKVKLCLSCHFGNKEKFADHRIMGAGHPRLRFELDTYSALQPFHHVEDSDYRSRKKVESEAKTWAVGQLAYAESFLKMVQKEAYFKDRLVPELSLFDCHACHSSMKSNKWRPRITSQGLGPGKLRFNDSSFVMIRFFADILMPKQHRQILQEIRQLHIASTKNFRAIKKAAMVLEQRVRQLMQIMMDTEFNQQSLLLLRAAIIKQGSSGEFSDYLSAEQAAMSLDLLSRRISNDEYQAISQQLDQLFEAISDENRYSPRAYKAAMLSIQQVLEK